MTICVYDYDEIINSYLRGSVVVIVTSEDIPMYVVVHPLEICFPPFRMSLFSMVNEVNPLL